MPPWAEVDGRLDDVQPNFDVYMLGKLLWCMVSGRLRLNREWFRNPENNVTAMFAKNDDPHLFIINEILEKCVVEDSKDCFRSASDLLIMVNHFVHSINRGGQLLREGVPRLCRVCGYGHYHPEQVRPSSTVAAVRFWPVGSFGPSDAVIYNVRPFCCDRCGHIQFFKGS
jgi:predicted Zn-ribbon and HTH transcriptional regulator